MNLNSTQMLFQAPNSHLPCFLGAHKSVQWKGHKSQFYSKVNCNFRKITRLFAAPENAETQDDIPENFKKYIAELLEKELIKKREIYAQDKSDINPLYFSAVSTLVGVIALYVALTNQVSNLSEKLDKRFDKLNEESEKKFELTNKHFNKMDEKFDKIDDKFDKIDENFEKINNLINSDIRALITSEITQRQLQFNDLNNALKRLEGKVAGLESIIESNNRNTIKRLEEKIEKLDKKRGFQLIIGNFHKEFPNYLISK